MNKNAKQFKGMSKDDLEKKLFESSKEMVKLRSQVYSGSSIKNPRLIRNTKKNIARINYQLGSLQKVTIVSKSKSLKK